MSNFTPQEIEEFLQEFFDVVGARQYVGARYVPIFGRAGEDTIEWDDLAPYEPLTVVMHLGVSYVSRRYVPTGIPIDDTAYWVETYRFNAQVEQYRQEVLGFSDRIDAIMETVESDYIPFPRDQPSKYGNLGQILQTLADGNTEWVDQQLPSEELMRDAVSDWLTDNPLANIFIESTSTIVSSSNYTTVMPDASAIRGTKVYRLVFSGGVTNIPANLPISTWPTGTTAGDPRTSALLFNIAGDDGLTSRVQLFISAKNIYTRSYLGGAWLNWQLVDNGAYFENAATPVVKALAQQVTYANYATVLPDLDTAPINTFVRILSLGDEASHAWPAHIPQEHGTTTVNDMVLTLATNSTYTAGLQLYVSSNSRIWARIHTSQGWLAWQALTVDPSLAVTYKNADYTIDQIRALRVDYTNYATVLPDLNEAPKYETFRIVSLGSEETLEWPANIPRGSQPARMLCVSTVETMGQPQPGYSSAVQRYVNKLGCWIREYVGGAWAEWHQMAGGDNHRQAIVVGAGKPYTSFSQAVIDAYNIGDCDVYVSPGTYDIVNEMKAIYGANYWANLSTSSPWFNGLPFGNGMQIIGSPGTILHIDASDITNTAVWDLFSVLMNQTGQSDTQKINSVRNVKFDCTCVRYCIHLDRGATDIDDTYQIEDCEFFLDNANNSMKTFAYCIGMGASINTTYEIRDCYFDSVRPANPRDVATVYYHNTNATSPLNKFVIEGCYIDGGGTIRIDTYGESLNDCKAIVSNNSVGAPLVVNVATANLKVLAWNNEVRA